MMMNSGEQINIGGINGLGEGLVNTNSQEFKHLQEMIKSMSSDQEDKLKIENEFLSIQFQMESYLNSDIETLIPAGGFIEKYLKVINIKKKDFAKYIDYDDSNLSALIRGRRKVNSEIAIKLGKIFSISPAIWLHIESKNELLKEVRDKSKSYGKYSLEDLMKKAV